MLSVVFEVCLWTVAGFWFWTAIRMSREVLGLCQLPKSKSIDSTEVPKSVTAVVAVRDGIDQIEATVAQLLSQSGVQLDVVIVNDRSVDGTTNLIDRLAEKDQRITAIHVDELPENWIGQCHALHLGAQAAAGEWILFTDADLRMKSDTLQRALRLAEQEGVEHISTFFRPRHPSHLAEACYNNFCIAALLGDYGGVNDDRERSFGGFGAFNLVQGEAMRAIGGYESLRMTVCNDSRLGKRLRAEGFRTRLFVGPEVTAEWGCTVASHVKLTEKNFFASTDYRTTHAILVTLLVWGAWAVGVVGGIFGLLTHSIPAFAAAVGLASTAFPSFLLATRVKAPRWVAVLTPCLWPILGWAILNSVFVTLKQNGVRWRDTFYRLDDLREQTYV